MGKLSFTAVIPAAGNSGRMGSQKVLMPYGNGSGFAEHLTNCFSVYGCDPVVLIVNENFDSATLQAKNLIIVVNCHVEKGRSHSIHLGLQHVPEGSACFIHNIDNPFPESAVLSGLLTAVPPMAMRFRYIWDGEDIQFCWVAGWLTFFAASVIWPISDKHCRSSQRLRFPAQMNISCGTSILLKNISGLSATHNPKPGNVPDLHVKKPVFGVFEFEACHFFCNFTPTNIPVSFKLKLCSIFF